MYMFHTDQLQCSNAYMYVMVCLWPGCGGQYLYTVEYYIYGQYLYTVEHYIYAEVLSDWRTLQQLLALTYVDTHVDILPQLAAA